MATELYDFGMIGLGTMGRNLLLNMADHGYAAAGFDVDKTKVTALESEASSGTKVKGFGTLSEMVQSLRQPRKIMMLVPAGKPVDDVIGNLLPLLSTGDIIIDGGNSHYTDTLTRIKFVEAKGFHFMGIGISGGEKGARYGPSIMPGGDEEAYRQVAPILEAVAAKVDGSPCVAYLGKDAAGHYVKMVHNGIEYSIMQLISETYWLMKKVLDFNNDQLHDVYKKWDEGEMKSFLLEITADVFRQMDDKSQARLVDVILDEAGSKGTGKWTSQDAMDLSVPVPSIDMAVSMRDLSSFRDERIKAAAMYSYDEVLNTSNDVPGQIYDALYFATVVSYAQGLALLQIASRELKLQIPVADVVRIWRGGCIIRSALLEIFLKSFQENAQLSNLLLDENVAELIRKKEKSLRNVVVIATNAGIPAAGMMTSLSYFDTYRSAQLPTNLIQAQRDYFGAHTYRRIDMEGIFHTEWTHT